MSTVAGGRRLALLFHLLAQRRPLRRHRRRDALLRLEVPRAPGAQGRAHRAQPAARDRVDGRADLRSRLPLPQGLRGVHGHDRPPGEPMEIKVNAKQWGWEFVYPNGGTDNELHVPVHKPVKLVMSSSDVIHSFFVPALRVKRDVVPGMYTTQLVRGDARRPGRHRVRRVLRRPQQGLQRQRAPVRADDRPLVDALDAPRRDAGGVHQVPASASATPARPTR